MTETRTYHLAQANIARMRAPIGDPIMDGFRLQLDHINRVAEESQGFVWRLQTEDGDATSIRAFGDELILVNMSVWESIEALHAYVYRSDHVGPLRRRRDWFQPFDGPALVMWWIPRGQLPTVDDAVAKLRMLGERGPTPGAFTFREPFPPPGQAAQRVPDVDAEFCR